MHFVIIGNGPAGVEAAFAIRRRHHPQQAQITIISDESDYFFSRTALMYAYMDKMPRPMLEPYERRVWDEQRIGRIRDRVLDLDADSQRITLKSGESISYDRLLLAVGARPRMVPFEGLEAVDEGIVHLVSLQDLDECERLTRSTRQAVVVGGGLIGVELAECFVHHGIDVTFLVREPWFWPMALGQEEADVVADHLRAHGVDLRLDEQLARLHADGAGRICAIETDRGSRVDCQMLGVAIGVTAHVDWLADATTPPQLDRGILVDRAFKTSLPNVWAAGDCAEVRMTDEQTLVETIWYSAKRHGQLAGASMLGDPVCYETPIFYNSTKFFELEFTTVGEFADLPSGTRCLLRSSPDKPISQRIVVGDHDQVLGFNMLGSRWDHRILMRWIHQRRSLAFVREHLHEAQFDVEFGRVRLDKMTEKEVSL